MDRTSLGQSKIVRDMGILSHGGLIITPYQKGKEDNVGLSFLLRKHAYSNILKILPPKKENFQIKKKL